MTMQRYGDWRLGTGWRWHRGAGREDAAKYHMEAFAHAATLH